MSKVERENQKLRKERDRLIKQLESASIPYNLDISYDDSLVPRICCKVCSGTLFAETVINRLDGVFMLKICKICSSTTLLPNDSE